MKGSIIKAGRHILFRGVFHTPDLEEADHFYLENNLLIIPPAHISTELNKLIKNRADFLIYSATLN